MPTYTKTTELRGYRSRSVIVDTAGGRGLVNLTELLPDEADSSLLTDRPRGTFRITVEFTPDE